jgi:GPI mannosyltransferase 1 subunit M
MGHYGHVGVIIMRVKEVRQAVVCGVLLRMALALFLSTYEHVYEQHMVFTDIDYKVYSDAALYPSPYDRHTYRYSPLLAYLMAGNYSLHEAVGKLVLSLFDGIAMVLLYLLVSRGDSGKHALLVLKMYAYNPLFIALTVRGSCESITLALMYAFWYCYFGGPANGNQSGLQAITNKVTVRQPDWRLRWGSYLLYGLWVHFRVYPIVLLPLLLAH